MTSVSTQNLLDDRYGRRRTGSGPRLSWIAVGVLAVAAVGYLGWTTVASVIDSVDVDTTSYQIHDEHTVTVDFQVTVRTGAAIACAVEAQDTDHGAVGWKVVSYPASEEHTRAFSETLTTTAEATTGLVTSCWIP